MQLRIQKGGDYETFSDGVLIQIDNVNTVRSELGQPLQVDLPPGVKPPGVPITAVANPSIVHLSLYLQTTCHTQDVALYGLGSTTMNGDGTCGGTPDGGNSETIVPEACGSQNTGLAPDASVPDAGDADAGGQAAALPVGHSTITFQHLFNGNPDETDAAERLTQGSFDVVPRRSPKHLPWRRRPCGRLPRTSHGQFQFLLRARTTCPAVPVTLPREKRADTLRSRWFSRKIARQDGGSSAPRRASA